MTLYIKKPVMVEAHQYIGTKENAEKLIRWCGMFQQENGMYGIQTLEGIMSISLGDFIIKGTQGEFYPCKPDAFNDSYVEA